LEKDLAMWIDGAIYPTLGATEFSREAWCQLVNCRPEFHRSPPRQARNPFAPDELMTVHPLPDTAQVVVDGRAVGNAYWSMSDKPLVNVSIEPFAMALVQEWATALGGEFRPDSPESNG
jgi:hypothetical protein